MSQQQQQQLQTEHLKEAVFTSVVTGGVWNEPQTLNWRMASTTVCTQNFSTSSLPASRFSLGYKQLEAKLCNRCYESVRY